MLFLIFVAIVRLVAQLVKNLPATQETRVQFLGREDPLQKEMADIYGVTYPTVRARLNGIIAKVKLSEEKREDPYISLVKRMVMEGKVDFEAAAVLIRTYREQKEVPNDNN